MSLPQTFRTVTTKHSRRARVGLVAAALLTLTACGGVASDAPTDATVEAFCTSIGEEDVDLTAEEAAEKLADIGTPEDISEAERNGFEAYVNALSDEGDTKAADVTVVEVSEDDKSDGEAFLTYQSEVCTEFLEELAPTDAPT